MLNSAMSTVARGARSNLHATLDQIRRQPVVGDDQIGEVVGNLVDQVVLTIEEGQPARLVFFDDVDLDAVNHRQLAPGQARGDFLRTHIAFRRLRRVEHVAVPGISLEHDAR